MVHRRHLHREFSMSLRSLSLSHISPATSSFKRTHPLSFVSGFVQAVNLSFEQSTACRELGNVEKPPNSNSEGARGFLGRERILAGIRTDCTLYILDRPLNAFELTEFCELK